MKHNSNPIRMERENLSALVFDEEQKMSLMNKYTALNVYRGEAVKAQREAARAQAQADIAISKVTLAINDFMAFAGELSDKVAMEPNWLPPFVNDQGEIILETPFSERNNRIAARAASSSLSRQVEASGDDFDVDLPGA